MKQTDSQKIRSEILRLEQSQVKVNYKKVIYSQQTVTKFKVFSVSVLVILGWFWNMFMG